MATTSDRSQPLLRIPRNQTPVTITLEDGEQASAMLFVAPGASVLRMLADAAAFVPVAFTSGTTRLVARDAIVCITVHVIHAHVEAHEELAERQKANVRLRTGQMVNGELRWMPESESRRVLDHLNDGSSHLTIHEGDRVSYVAKSHVASVEEV